MLFAQLAAAQHEAEHVLRSLEDYQTVTRLQARAAALCGREGLAHFRALEAVVLELLE